MHICCCCGKAPSPKHPQGPHVPRGSLVRPIRTLLGLTELPCAGRCPSPYLLDFGLQRAVERPRLHVFRHQALLPECVQGEPLLGGTQVRVGGFAILCCRQKGVSARPGPESATEVSLRDPTAAPGLHWGTATTAGASEIMGTLRDWLIEPRSLCGACHHPGELGQGCGGEWGHLGQLARRLVPPEKGCSGPVSPLRAPDGHR